MSIETIYFKTEQNPAFEEKLSRFSAYTGCTVADDRRSFLTTLAEAVGRSESIITVGPIALLSSVLARGLGQELSPVEWAELGLTPREDVLLPKGALPLVMGDNVSGMILENSGQCIISLNADEGDISSLCENYVLPYLDALAGGEVEEETVIQVVEEEKVDKMDVKAPVTTPESILEMMAERPVDIFADMTLTEEEIDNIVPPKSYKGLRSFIIFVVILALLATGGYFGYTRYLAPNQFDKMYAEAIDAFENNKPDDDVFSTKQSNYSTDFSSLYKINRDVIGWLEVEGLDLKMPFVTGANHSSNYYDDHTFDKAYNYYGSAFVTGFYNKSNLHPNTVIRAKTTDEERMFAGLKRYLDSSFALANNHFYTQTVYEEEMTKWEIFAVLEFENNKDGYMNSFAEYSASQRQGVIRSALENSKVNFSVDKVSYLNDMGTYRYTTLVTRQNGKYIAVMAREVAPSVNGEVTKEPVVENTEDTQSEVSENTESEVSEDTQSEIGEE